MPKTTRCIQCQKRHKKCVPLKSSTGSSTRVETNGALGTCVLCSKLGLECIPAPPPVERKGSRIERAKLLFGTETYDQSGPRLQPQSRRDSIGDVASLGLSSLSGSGSDTDAGSMSSHGGSRRGSGGSLSNQLASHWQSLSSERTAPLSLLNKKTVFNRRSSSSQIYALSRSSNDDEDSPPMNDSRRRRPASWNPQNTRPSSDENMLRRHQLIGLLTLDLMKDAIKSLGETLLNVGTGGLGSVRDSFDDFLRRFVEDAQMDPKSPKLGQFGECQVALFCAVGSHTLIHSAIVGPLANNTPSHLSGDLRAFGEARKGANDSLWAKCLNICESSKISESDTCLGWVTLALIAFATSRHYDFPQARSLQKTASDAFWQVSNGDHGFTSRALKHSWFEFMLTKDLCHAMKERRLPLVSDIAITAMMSSATSSSKPDGKVFVSFDGPDTVPRPTSLFEHHRISWATVLAINRMITVANVVVEHLPLEQASRVARTVWVAFLSRRAWRQSTYQRIEPSDIERASNEAIGVPTLGFANMTVFGEEQPGYQAQDDAVMRTCLFSIFALVQKLAARTSTSETAYSSTAADWNLGSMLDECRVQVHQELEILLEAMKDEEPEAMHYGHVVQISSLRRLPDGVSYIADFVNRSRNAEEFARRNRQADVLKTHLRSLAYEGGIQLDSLKQLEIAMTKITNPATPSQFLPFTLPSSQHLQQPSLQGFSPPNRPNPWIETGFQSDTLLPSSLPPLTMADPSFSVRTDAPLPDPSDLDSTAMVQEIMLSRALEDATQLCYNY